MSVLWILLLCLALAGAPLFLLFGAAAMGLFGSLPDTSITGAANDVFSEKFADSPMLVTIPLFTFAGYLMAESGTPRRLVALSRAWLGWMPGGLAVVCLAASAFFTSFTGGSGITIVAIGGLLLPALLQDRYPERFSLGLVTAGGSLGLLFPPSLPLILYGVVAGVLVEKLFLAGILPGLLSVGALAGYAMLVGGGGAHERHPFRLREAAKSLWESKWEVLLPVGLLGGLYSGALRIHEAAAFTALYVLVVEVWVYRDVSFREDLPRIVREAVTLVGAILIILATAIGFTAFLIQAQVPQQALEVIARFIDSKWAFLLALNLFLIVTGMLMDIFSAIVVVVPLIVPIARHFGVDPYHLAIVFLLNLEIGYLTPPVGLNLFISSFRFERPVTVLYRAVLPFIGLLLLALAFTTYVPWLSVALVEAVGGPLAEAPMVEPPAEEAPGDSAADSERDAGGEEGLDLDALEEDLEHGAAAAGEDEEGLDLDALEEQLEGHGADGGTAPPSRSQGGGADDELDLKALERELGGRPGPP